MSEGLRFGTVSAPQTTPKSGTAAAVAHIRELGLDHLEIAWVRGVRVGDETCAQIKEIAQVRGVSLSIHAPYFINLNSQTPEKMAASHMHLLTAARRGFACGATDIVFHPGSYHNQPVEQVYENIVKSLAEVWAILREEGTEVTLRPETMGKPSLFGSLDELLALSRDVPGVLPCIDWAHLHARQLDGAFNSYDEFSAALDAMRAALGDAAMQRVHFHLSGIDYGPKGEKAHLPLNEADLNYRALMQVFVDHGVQGTAAVEAPRPFHTADALTFQATYRRLRSQNDAAEVRS